MKKLILSLLSVLLVFPAIAQTNFRSISFDEAIKQAKAENKLVFIDFYTDWCGPCKKMAREVFPQKAVGDYFNATFVCIKLNAEKEGKELATRFKVNAYPTFLVLDTDEKVKMDIKGAFPADAFIAKVKNELNPDMTPERMKERYDSGERTPELINAYAMSFMEKKQEKEGFKIVDEYFNSLTDEQKLAADNFFLFSRYTIDLNNPRADFLSNHLNEFDNSVRQKAKEHAQKLYRAALVSYVSGYEFADKKYNEADYLALKNKIKQLGLDKDYPYQPLFELTECYAKGDLATYFNMIKAKKEEMAKEDFELILLNTTRLFPDNSPQLVEMGKYIRTLLPEMRASSILMMGRLLMSIEKTE